MKLFKNLFRSRDGHVLRITDEHSGDAQQRYAGEFVVRGLNVFDKQGRLRGFVFEPGDPTPARIQSFIAGARQAGHISDDLMRTLFAHVRRDDFLVQRESVRDVLLFPSDIFAAARSRQMAPLTEAVSRQR